MDYRVNEAVLDTAFMGNDLALSRIDSLAAGMRSDVDSIIILGTASPEGNPDHNLRLAGRRVQTFRDHLVGKYPQFDSAAVRTGVRLFLWDDLVDRLKADHNLPDSAEVMKVLSLHGESDRYKGNRLRTRCREAYYYINENYLSYLRKGQVTVYYRSDEAVLAEPEPEPELPQTAAPEPVEYDSICTDSVAAPLEDEPQEPDSACSDSTRRRRELLSVKTNLLFDFAWMPGYDRWCPIPNVAIEYYPLHGHFTYGFSFDCPWWSNYDEHKYFQVRNYQLDTRYYFRPTEMNTEGAAFKGLFVNAYAHAGLWSICFDADRGWVGEGLGGGVGVGYVLPIGKSQHWRLEGAAQFGALWCRYDPYQYESPVEPAGHDNLYYYKWTRDADLFRPRMYRWLWLGPTRVAITLSADIIFRKPRMEK